MQLNPKEFNSNTLKLKYFIKLIEFVIGYDGFFGEWERIWYDGLIIKKNGRGCFLLVNDLVASFFWSMTWLLSFFGSITRLLSSH